MSKTITLPPHTPSVLKGFKLPLTPIKDGFGYYGTLTYDKSLTFTQCFICGWFYRKVSQHVNLTHGISVKRYKFTYGFPISQGTVSLSAPNTRLRNIAEVNLEASRKGLAKARRKVEQNPELRRGSSGISLFERNKRGNCPDQLMEKMAKLKEQLGRLPSSREFTKAYGKGTTSAVIRTFRSWSEAKRLLESELPSQS